MKISRMKLWTALILFASAEMLYTQQHSTRLKTSPQDEAPLLSDSNLNAYRRFKRDSSDFRSEEFILSDIAHSIQTRASNDSLKSAVDRLQKIARILNGISLQQGLITGSVPSDELISELLFFGSVTPSGIAKLDFEKIESAITALESLPNALAPTDVATKMETSLEALEEIKKTVDGAGNLTEWNSTHFESEIERLASNGISAKFINVLSASLLNWQNFYEELNKEKTTLTQSTFAELKAALEKINNSISTANQSLPLWKFNGFDTVMDGISPLTKIAGGLRLYLNHSGVLSFSDADINTYVDFVTHYVDGITEITDLDSSLKDIKEVVATRERRSRHRNLRHTHGLSRGSSDVSQMMIDVSDQWIKDVLKTDGIRIAFKQFEEIIGLLNGMDRSLDFSGKGSFQINQFLDYRDRFVGVMEMDQLKTALPDSLKCSSSGMSPANSDKFDELMTSLEGIDDKLKNLKKQTDLLSKALSTPGLSEMCDDVIKICEGKDVPTMINDFKNYEKLDKLNNHLININDIVVDINYLKIGTLKGDAEDANSKMTALDTYHDSLIPYADYFTCLQDQKQLDSVFNAIRDIQNIRKFQNDQSFSNSMKNGLDVVKKVIGSKDGLKTLKAAVAHMKGFQSPETLALKDLKNVSIHSQVIGSSVEGVSNMENALKQKSAVSKILENIQLVKVNQQLVVDSEDVENLKTLIGLEPVIQKMYQSLDQFSGVVEDSESPRLQNHSKIFKQAESVTGIKGNFLKMSTSIGKLKEKITDPGDKKKLEDVESSLKTMDSMGLDFSVYQKSFKESSKSLEAVDVMFASLPTKLAKAPPSAIQQGQLWKKEDPAKTIMDLIMNNLMYIAFGVGGILLLTLLTVITIMFFCCRTKLKKTIRLIFCCSTRRRKTHMDLFEKCVLCLFDSIFMSTEYTDIDKFLEEHPGEKFVKAAIFHFCELYDEDDRATCHGIEDKPLVDKELFTRKDRGVLYDEHRVRLNFKGNGNQFENDFYYSTMVNLPNRKRAVCAQLALKKEEIESYVKFWFMVKQLKTKSVVMTTPHKVFYEPIPEKNVDDSIKPKKQEERSTDLGIPFFPKKVGETMDILDLKLTCTEIEEQKEYKTKNGENGFPILKILVEFPNEKTFLVDLIWHRHCYQLDAKSVQAGGMIGNYNPNPEPMIRTLKMIQSSKTPPILCSLTGVANVGILLYVDMLHDMLKEDDPFLLKGTLLKIRKYNRGFISTQQEFLYSLYILMEFLAEGLVIEDPLVKDVYERLKTTFKKFMDYFIEEQNFLAVKIVRTE